jgi:competence protein ComEA
MKTWQNILLGIILGLLLSAIIYLVAVPPKGTPISLNTAPTTAPLIIDISGAVNQPGIYALPRSSRISDAIAAAGGTLDSAIVDSLNLAQPIRDGEKIHILEIGENAPPAPAQSGNLEIPHIIFPINLNTASQSELETLPGIGAARAQDIRNYREVNGDFQAIEDIQKVPGIGPATYERIRMLITVDSR